MKLLLASLLFFSTVAAQDFITFYQSTSATSEVITVQQPASGAKTVRFIGAMVECSVACTITLERNGTVASSTVLTVLKLNPSSTIAATATAWRSSNVGAGTVVGKYGASIPPTGGIILLDLSKAYMTGSGTAKNLSLRIASSSSGTYNTLIQHSETAP